MYVQNPYRNPPTTDGQNERVSRTQTRKAAHAARGGPSNVRRFKDTSVPNVRVMGAITSAGPGLIVTQVRSTPCGANTRSVKSRPCPWAIAHGVHPKAHWKKLESGPPPQGATNRESRCATTGRPQIATDRDVYARKTPKARTLGRVRSGACVSRVARPAPGSRSSSGPVTSMVESST